MLKSILIGLDGSEDNEGAWRLGLRWAKELGATADGLAVVDDPGMLTTQAAMLFDVYPDGSKPDPLPHRLRQRAEEARAAFEQRCSEAGVKFRARAAEGVPAERIVEEVERSDLVVLGRPTHFEFGSGASGGDATLLRVIRESPRPVVSVPKGPVEGAATVVAVDGSHPSARALAMFQAAGLGRSGPVHVVVASAEAEAARRAERAVDYLKAHDLDARPAVEQTSRAPADVILEAVDRLGAGLLVMGAHGKSPVREFLVGSTTRRLLGASRVPVFCHH